MAKKKGREFSPVFLSNNLIDLKEKEEVTGVCKAFTIELKKNKHATGTINERCGLKIIGEFSLKNERVGKLSEYFRQMDDKGKLELVHWGGWRNKISQFIFFHFTRRGRLNMRAPRVNYWY